LAACHKSESNFIGPPEMGPSLVLSVCLPTKIIDLETRLGFGIQASWWGKGVTWGPCYMRKQEEQH